MDYNHKYIWMWDPYGMSHVKNSLKHNREPQNLASLNKFSKIQVLNFLIERSIYLFYYTSQQLNSSKQQLHVFSTMSVHLLTNYHPFKLHTPGINLVLDYCDNCKLFSVAYYKQLRKLQSVLNTWCSTESFWKSWQFGNQNSLVRVQPWEQQVLWECHLLTGLKSYV